MFKYTFDNVELLNQDMDKLIVQLSDKINIVLKKYKIYVMFYFQ